MVRQRRRLGRRALQPLRPQGHAAGQRRRGNTGTLLPLPVPRLDLPPRRRAARRAAGERLRRHARCATARPGQGMQAPAGVAVHRDFVFVQAQSAAAPTSRATSARRWRAIDNLVDRSPVGRLSIAGGVPAQPDPLQLEDLPREHQRHGASAVDARVGDRRGGRALWQGHAGRRAQADGDGADPAVRLRPRLLRPDGRPRVLPNGHSVLGTRFSIHSGYAPAARLRGGDARRARRRARGRDPAALAAERALLSEPGAEGLAAGDPRDPPARRRPHAGRGLELSRRGRARRCCSSARSATTGSSSRRCRSSRTTTCTSSRASSRACAARATSGSACTAASPPTSSRTPTRDVNGTNEMLMRNQFRAWVKFMTLDMAD